MVCPMKLFQIEDPNFVHKNSFSLLNHGKSNIQNHLPFINKRMARLKAVLKSWKTCFENVKTANRISTSQFSTGGIPPLMAWMHHHPKDYLEEEPKLWYPWRKVCFCKTTTHQKMLRNFWRNNRNTKNTMTKNTKQLSELSLGDEVRI